jgi:hypothetical protein
MAENRRPLQMNRRGLPVELLEVSIGRHLESVQGHHRGLRRDCVRTIDLDLVVVLRLYEFKASKNQDQKTQRATLGSWLLCHQGCCLSSAADRMVDLDIVDRRCSEDGDFSTPLALIRVRQLISIR